MVREIWPFSLIQDQPKRPTIYQEWYYVNLELNYLLHNVF